MLLTKLNHFRRLPLNWSGFSSQKKQKALWASLFISKILNETAANQMQQPSLLERMLASSLDLTKIQTVDPTFEIDPAIAAEMKSIFVQGAPLSKLIYQQYRIRGASVETYQDEFNRGSQARMSSKYLHFTFLPNFIVTQKVFKQVMSSFQRPYNLFSGHYGTSKTTAFILFHYLAGIINDYAHGSLQPEKSQITAFQNAKLLRKVPLVLYLTLKKDNNFDFSSITQILKSQVPFLEFAAFEDFQKSKQEQQRKKSGEKLTMQEMEQQYFEHVIETIKPKRTNKISILTIIDQINSLVAECRDFNSGKEKNQNERHKIQIKLNTKLTAVRRIVKGLSPVIFNSSVNIEKELMQKPPLPSQKSLDFDMEHDKLVWKNLSYTQNLSKKWGAVSFKHYVRDQLEMKLKILLADAKLFKRVQPDLHQLLNTILEPIELPHYLRFLNFRENQNDTFIAQFGKIAPIFKDFTRVKAEQEEELAKKIKDWIYLNLAAPQNLTQQQIEEIAKVMDRIQVKFSEEEGRAEQKEAVRKKIKDWIYLNLAAPQNLEKKQKEEIANIMDRIWLGFSSGENQTEQQKAERIKKKDRILVDLFKHLNLEQQQKQEITKVMDGILLDFLEEEGRAEQQKAERKKIKDRIWANLFEHSSLTQQQKEEIAKVMDRIQVNFLEEEGQTEQQKESTKRIKERIWANLFEHSSLTQKEEIAKVTDRIWVNFVERWKQTQTQKDKIKEKIKVKFLDYWGIVCSESEAEFIKRIKFNIIKSNDQNEILAKLQMILEILQIALKATGFTENERREREIDADLEPQQKNHFVLRKNELSKQVQNYLKQAKNNVKGSIDKELLAYQDKIENSTEFLVFDYSAEYLSATFSKALSEFVTKLTKTEKVLLSQELMVKFCEGKKIGMIFEDSFISLLKVQNFKAKVTHQQLVLDEKQQNIIKFEPSQQITWKIRSAETFLHLNDLFNKRKQIKNEKDWKKKAAHANESKQLEDSAQASLRELIAKTLLSASEEYLLATPVKLQEKAQNSSENKGDHSLNSIAIDFMMLTTQREKNQIVVRSYDATIGNEQKIKEKITDSGEPLNLLNHLLLKSIDELNRANGTKFTLDYGHCIIGLSEQLPREGLSRALYRLNKKSAAETKEIARYKIFLSELDTLQYQNCTNVYRRLLFENMLIMARYKNKMIADSNAKQKK